MSVIVNTTSGITTVVETTTGHKVNVSTTQQTVVANINNSVPMPYPVPGPTGTFDTNGTVDGGVIF